ncbi:hypothetical protein BJX65DRAFT_34925 [Aspergillus insuetus]
MGGCSDLWTRQLALTCFHSSSRQIPTYGSLSLRPNDAIIVKPIYKVQSRQQQPRETQLCAAPARQTSYILAVIAGTYPPSGLVRTHDAARSKPVDARRDLMCSVSLYARPRAHGTGDDFRSMPTCVSIWKAGPIAAFGLSTVTGSATKDRFARMAKALCFRRSHTPRRH